MCGIAGLYLRHEKVLAEEVALLGRRLVHRGPDAAGTYVDGRMGLAHTRLSIIDLTGGRQPLVDPQSGTALVVNGEIYNYLELREDLLREGASFATASDSEVLLQGYLLHGIDFVRRVNGMFAFGLYDPQKEALILGRDRLGIKPLYFLTLGDRVAFASELKALLPLLPRRPEVEPEALLQYLQSQFSTGAGTIVRGIERLSPGELLTVTSNLDAKRTRYWSASDVVPQRLTLNEAEEVFSPLFDQVMTEHMRSDVPFGLFLSGGVDSAVLLAMLSRLQGRTVKTMSVGFKDVRMRDEAADAKWIASQFDTEHCELILDRKVLFRRVPHMVWATDDLMRDYASLPVSLLSQFASRDLKVVFSGEGGDEAFAGYGRYRPGRLEALVKGALWPGSGGFRTRGHWRGPWPRRVFGNDLSSLEGNWRIPYRRYWKMASPRWSPLAKRQYVDLMTNLPDDLLVKADRIMMSFGLEGRVPFLDHRLVEFGLSLPDELKVVGGQGKYFLKKWAERYLPADYLWRKKRGFHVPIGEWFVGSFLDQLEKRLLANEGILRWFEPEGVRALFRARQAGKNTAREIWSLMQFAIWHRLFIAGDGSAPPLDTDPLDWIA